VQTLAEAAATARDEMVVQKGGIGSDKEKEKVKQISS